MIPNHRRQRLFHCAALALVALNVCFASLTGHAEETKPQEDENPISYSSWAMTSAGCSRAFTTAA